MRRVIIESPYAAADDNGVAANLAYARLCVRDSLSRGEAPFASHIIYTQCLRDNVELERTMAIRAGLCWGSAAEATIVYVDYGISRGMQIGIDDAKAARRPIEYRKLDLELARTITAVKSPPPATTATKRAGGFLG
jgi:hypothetical protein